MKIVVPYEGVSSALEALDNGGLFFNFFTKAGDDNISSVELAKVAGVFGDAQLMFLFLEMATHDLDDKEKETIHRTLSDKLQTQRAEHLPQELLVSEADEKGIASRTAILTGIPRFVEDKTTFNGYILIPIFVNNIMMMTMFPIMDHYDIYGLVEEESGGKTFIATVRGAPRIPETLHRFGGVLKETSKDAQGEMKDRLFLEAAFYTPLSG